jgi:hypothetical protein
LNIHLDPFRSSEEKRFYQFVEGTTGEGFGQDISKIVHAGDVKEVYDSSGDSFSNSMVGNRVMFLLQLRQWHCRIDDD